MMRTSGGDDGSVHRASTIPSRRKSPCDAVLVVWTMMSDESESRMLTRSRTIQAMVAFRPSAPVGVVEATACPARMLARSGMSGTPERGNAARHASASNNLRARQGKTIRGTRRQESTRNDSRIVAGPRR